MAEKRSCKMRANKSLCVEDSGLTVVQEQVAVSLAMGLTIADISKKHSVPSSTIYEWRQQEAFAAHYKRLQREVVREIRGRLSQMADSAIKSVEEIMEGGGEQARLKAACYILDFMTGDQREARKLKIKAQRDAKK